MSRLKIEYKGVDSSEALSALIESRVEKLEHFFDQIQSCRVVVSAPHKHHRNKYYHTQIQLNVPRTTLMVDHETELNDRHLDPFQSVNDAFAAMTRKLESYVQKLRGKVKAHATP